MNTGKTLFSQLMDFLPTYEFNRCVRRYRGNHRVRRFSCRDQFLSRLRSGSLFASTCW